MHPGDVRRGHPGYRRDGAVAVQPRRYRPVDDGRPQPCDVRFGRHARHVRQDRARAADRRPALRLSADDLLLRGRDADRHLQQGEAARPPALCRGQGDARRAARQREPVLSRARRVHVLRHGQFQPDDARDDGAAAARLGVHQPGHAAAPGADPRGGSPPGRDRPRPGIGAGTATITARWRTASTSVRSSTPRSGCWRRAGRPTTRCTCPPSPAPPGS